MVTYAYNVHSLCMTELSSFDICQTVRILTDVPVKTLKMKLSRKMFLYVVEIIIRLTDDFWYHSKNLKRNTTLLSDQKKSFLQATYFP